MSNGYDHDLDTYKFYHPDVESNASALLSGPALPALGHGLAGSTGAAISTLCTYPLSLIVTRLQIQRHLPRSSNTSDSTDYKSTIDAAQKIYSNEGGIAGLYAGCLQDTTKTVADSFLFFLAHNYVRQSRLRSRSDGVHHLPVLEELSVGVVAGAFSKLLTTPISNVVTRLQTASMIAARSGRASSTKKVTVSTIVNDIQAEKGLLGFWSGYSASLILTLNPSLTFFFFETLKRATLPRDQRAHPPARATFFLAAVSKALASSITYPFSLAKSRAQITSRFVDEEDNEVKQDIEKLTHGKTSGSRRGRDVARNTVFSTILHIARTEGISALYEGLAGEMMKGFFSHGITMLVKDAVHSFVIQLYYAILKLLRNFPDSQEVAQSVREKAHSSIEKVQEGGQGAIAGGQELTGKGTEMASKAYGNTRDTVKSAVESLQAAKSTAANHLSVTGSDAYQKVQSVAGDLTDRASTTTSIAYESAADAVKSAGNTIQANATSAIDRASQATNGVYQTGKSVTNDLAGKVSDTASRIYQRATEAVSSEGGSASPDGISATERLSQTANEVYQRGQKLVDNVAERSSTIASDSWRSTKDAVSAAGESVRATGVANGNQASDVASAAYTQAEHVAGTTLTNANSKKDSVSEYVGKKLENAGHALRPSKQSGNDDK